MTDGPLVLGIETSCDETGVGHRPREHPARRRRGQQRRRARTVRRRRARGRQSRRTSRRWCRRSSGRARPRASDPHDVDAIAVTNGPGLAGALLVGVAAAKALALGLGKPIYGVNHLAAHVAVDQLEHGPLPEPCLAMLVERRPLQSCCASRTSPVASTRSGRRSTTRPARPSTRWPGCSGCRSPAARTSTGPPASGSSVVRRLPARADRAGGTWSGTASTSRSRA